MTGVSDTAPDGGSSPLSDTCGVMEGYRSRHIGRLVAARAKAAAGIKVLVEARGRAMSGPDGFAGFLAMLEEAIAENGLAVFQTIQDRGRDGMFLITTLAHESDQWICAEIRIRCAYVGPEALEVEMACLRRHAVLAALAIMPGADPGGGSRPDALPAAGIESPARHSHRG